MNTGRPPEIVLASSAATYSAKGHGVGYLYPPKDSPDGWEKDHDVPQWIWGMWDYIVRGALGLKCTPPAWVRLPQMMRICVTTYNVLKMLREWKGFRPYNFLLMPMVDPTFGRHFYVQRNEKILLVTQFSSKQDKWFGLRAMNVYTAELAEGLEGTWRREQIEAIVHEIFRQ